MPVALTRKPLPKPNPQADPRFRKITDQLKQGAAKTKAHPPAAKKAADAAKAAKGPPNERLASGKAKQVDKIQDAKEGKPEQSSFLSILRAEIAKAMPKTLGETENFDQSAQAMKGGLKGNVAQQKDSSTKDVSGASKQTPGPEGQAKTEQPLPPEGASPAPNVNAAEGMPAPKSDADVSLQDSKQNTDEQMKEAEVTTPQLEKANDPRFSAVVGAKAQVAQNADAGPGKYRAAEKAASTAAATGAASDARKGAAAMLGVRGGSATKVLTRQQKQKAADEAKRKAVVDKIEAIYAATKARVDAKLAAMDPEVNGMFDSGVDAALNTMTRFVNDKIFDYKLRRYLSIPIVGAARWIRDQFLGLPSEVNAIYEQGRVVFQAAMDALIVRVAAVVEKRLKEAKAEVAKGQAEIKAFVASQPKDLQQVAQQAQADVASRFAELEAGIEEKKNSLAQSLAQKYKEGFDKANEALKKIQDENKGLVQGFIEKLAEVIKALLEFKAKLMAILRKGMETIKLIIADPLGFLGNLIAAVKGGIQAFVGNIWTHLKAGFMKWLFGNLPPGVSIPADLSLVSIFKLVMGVLGITYDKMRAKAVKLIGNTAVTVIEKLVGYIYTLVSGGPAALWEQVKGDLASLKSMVIDAIQTWLIETVVKQAVMKIVSMFNPAGAIVQAIIAIYNIVMFVVEKAQQIMAFVEAVVNSVHAIATGAIGGAIKWIESALARTIPIVIGFLARLIGLGGISQKIRDFIMKVQSKVDQAIDKALKVIVDKVKKLFGGAKDKKEDRTEDQKRKDVHSAIQDAAAAARGKQSWLGLKSKLKGIKAKYRLTELAVAGGSKGKIRVKAKINPDETKEVDAPAGDAKKDVTEGIAAAGELGQKSTAAAQGAASVPAAPRGAAHAEARAAALAQRPGVTRVPTQLGKNPRGIDVAFVTDDGTTLEFNEIKEGGNLTIFNALSASKGGKVRGSIPPIEVPAAQRGADVSAAAAHMRAHPEDVPKVVAGAKLIQRRTDESGKEIVVKLDNELSALTNAIGKAIERMYKAIRAAASDPTLAEATIAQIRSILAGEGGTLRLVIDIKKSASFTPAERDLARALLKATFDKLVAAATDNKTKLDLVLRRVDEKGTAQEEKL